MAMLVVLAVSIAPAHALKPIIIDPEADRIELTTLGDPYDGRGDTLQVETAPGSDGSTGRISVRARTQGTNPNWIVFALRNDTDKAIERWVTAERYNPVGSGIIWPDLDARRIENLTPSVGFIPERIRNDRADVFRVTLEPGQTITYVAELATERYTRLFLWKSLDYEQRNHDRQLFNGIMLGITGILALFLTAVFAANHKLIFPAAALVAWAVLAYLCVDFGFWHKLFQMRAENAAQYRAVGEAAVAASLVIFLYVFLRIGYWRSLFRLLFGCWIAGQLVLIPLGIVDPRLAATFARLSFLAIGAVGGVCVLVLALRGQDRALSLVPTWIFLGVWLFGAGVMLTGRLGGEFVASSLVAGIVMIVVLIGFTVTQFAFRNIEPLYGATPDQQQLRSLAVEGAGAAVWEWNSRRDEVKNSPNLEATLGLPPGELSCKTEDFVQHLHAADRDRFRLALTSLRDKLSDEMHIEIRIRHADSSYRWLEIEAAAVPTPESRAVRCVGLIRDVTNAKRAQERLMHDAVHDSLTGFPNRELFLDRLAVAFARAKAEPAVRPTVIFIDLDRFKNVNSAFGLAVGDSLLLTIGRRIARNISPTATAARIGGNQFAVLLIEALSPPELAALADRMRRSLRAPIKIAGQEIVITASFGVALFDGGEATHHDLLKEAEVAMYRARRQGTDHIEVFKAEMREQRDERAVLEGELRKAIERKQLTVQYQPIVFLPTEELAGFEALVRWEHPTLGTLNPSEFVPLAEESNLIHRLGSFVLGRAVVEAQRWQKELPRAERPLFVSVNISSRQLITNDLVLELRQILAKAGLPRGSVKLEITESLVMENPEQATRMLELLKDAGVDLSLDDFGTGYSSLAYLQRFAFDAIKIDRSLVQAAGRETNSAGGAIVRSIVALAHELGKKVVAEGVEEADDVAFLRSLDCEYVQGFYYGTPESAGDAVGLLKQIRKQERKLRRRAFFQVRPKSKSAPETAAPAAGAPGVAPPPVRPGEFVPAARPRPANGSMPLANQGPGAPAPITVPPPSTKGSAPPAQTDGNAGRPQPSRPTARIRPRPPQPVAGPPVIQGLPPTSRPNASGPPPASASMSGPVKLAPMPGPAPMSGQASKMPPAGGSGQQPQMTVGLAPAPAVTPSNVPLPQIPAGPAPPAPARGGPPGVPPPGAHGSAPLPPGPPPVPSLQSAPTEPGTRSNVLPPAAPPRTGPPPLSGPPAPSSGGQAAPPGWPPVAASQFNEKPLDALSPKLVATLARISGKSGPPELAPTVAERAETDAPPLAVKRSGR